MSSIRRQCSDQDDCGDSSAALVSLRSSMSRENSVARSVNGRSEVTSPTPSNASDSNNRDGSTTRSYARSYSSRVLDGSSAHSSPTPHSAEGYSSASLGRRSLFSSHADHVTSLPRRANRYSVHEPETSHTKGHSYGMAPLRSASSRSSSYVTSPTSRYTSIYEDSARENLLSPTSLRRSNPLSDGTATTRRESTFYGMPSSRDSSLNRRDAGTTSSASSSYFVRGSSSGLDSTSSSYATMRPSFMRYRR